MSKNSTHFSNKVTFTKSNSKLRKYMDELSLICIQCLLSFMFLDSSKKFLEGRGNLEMIKLQKAGRFFNHSQNIVRLAHKISKF